VTHTDFGGNIVKTLVALLLTAIYVVPTFAAAPPSPACDAKRSSIEAQIAEAKAHGNRQQLAGLNTALRANKMHCTDASLEAARQRDIAAATKKVAQRESDLTAAQAKGNQKKIAKQQAQLDAARQALAEAQKPLLP
jgi:Protein of unknown function (DUF1090)